MTVLAIVVFCVFYLVGVAGIILPVLPGVPLAAVGALIAGWLTGFEGFGWTSIGWITGLAVLSVGLDYVAGLVGRNATGRVGRGCGGASSAHWSG